MSRRPFDLIRSNRQREISKLGLRVLVLPWVNAQKVGFCHLAAVIWPWSVFHRRGFTVSRASRIPDCSFLCFQFDKDEMASDSRLALVQRRDEMLLLSERCFTSALAIEDGEAWLHHYILGKISEKLKKPPSVYLEHYQMVRMWIRNKFSN